MSTPESIPPHNLTPMRQKIHDVIFEADTPAGKTFDIVLIVAIMLSVLVVMIDTVESYSRDYHGLLFGLEWVFTAMFTVEYVLRLLSVRRPLRYAFSFFGLVDLLSILPTYLALFIPGTQHLMVIRALRLLRIFRVFKLARFLSEADALRTALSASRAKITVFLVTVVILVIISGTAMYVIEGPNGFYTAMDRPAEQVEQPKTARTEPGPGITAPGTGDAASASDPPPESGQGNPGFSSIPQSIYWAVVTITTVGYGDATPQTVAGKALAAIMMLIGYSMIIVPTGIISGEMARTYKRRDKITTQSCPSCTRDGHDPDATHCKHCGEPL